jgi:hypothetical protein
MRGSWLELGAGELMRAAPRVRRQLLNYGPSRVVLIALGADGEHDGRDAEAFASWEENTGAQPRECRCPTTWSQTICAPRSHLAVARSVHTRRRSEQIAALPSGTVV